ncbi:MAG TPA: hypothetical protein VNL14_08150 [Candidatus Acidoferrales bacterium]|nr:hypothetical protein [Candidatus Acidoferrales bacterium]
MAAETRSTLRIQPSALFEPDPVATFRYAEQMKPGLGKMPEKMLMWAVLEDAIACLQEGEPEGGKSRGRRAREARDWIMEKNSDWFFSFESICAALDLDANYVRRRLLEGGSPKAVLARARVHARKPVHKRKNYRPAA